MHKTKTNIISPFALILLFIFPKMSYAETSKQFAFDILEFQIKGGFSGYNFKGKISQDGKLILKHYRSWGKGKPQDFQIVYPLPQDRYDKINQLAQEIDIWNLPEEYPVTTPPEVQLSDGISYSLTFHIGDKYVNTSSSGRGATRAPNSLKLLMRELLTLSRSAMVESNAVTIVINHSYFTVFKLKKWPYSHCLEIPIGKPVYFSSVPCGEELRSFIEQLKHEDKFCFYDETELFTLSSYSSAYVQFDKKSPIRYWDENFGFKLSEVSNTGVVIVGDQINEIKQKVKKTFYSPYYVVDELVEGGLVVQPELIPGQPVW